MGPAQLIVALLLWSNGASAAATSPVVHGSVGRGGSCIAGEGNCATSVPTEVGQVLLQARGRVGHSKVSLQEQTNEAIGSSIAGDASDTLIGHWTFEESSAELNPESADTSSTWSLRVPDKSAKAGPMTFKRYKWNYPYATLRPVTGLDNTGGIYFESASSATADVAEFRSIAFWARRDADCCSDRVMNWVTAKRPDGTLYFRIYIHAAQVRVDTYSSSGALLSFTLWRGWAQTPLEEWFHVAVVVHTNTVNIYIDGTASKDGEWVGNLATDLGSDVQLVLQLGTGGANHQFKGMMDEVSIYSDAVTAEFVQGLYALRSTEAAGTTGTTSTTTTTTTEPEEFAGPNSMIGHWRFDDPAGTRHFLDSSGKGNTLLSHRTSFQHLWAEIVPGEGLGGSGGLKFFSRSLATFSPMPMFKSLAFWSKRDQDCCERVDNWVKVWLDEAMTQPAFALYVSNDYLTALAYHPSGAAVAAARTASPVKQSDDQPEWVHIAVTMSRDALSLYLNGELKNSYAYGFGSLYSGYNVTFNFGTGADANQYQGISDELRLYTAPLTPEDVAALASAQDSKGTMGGEKLPPRAYAGLTQTLWEPVTSTKLAGECVAPDGGTSTVTASWQVVSPLDTSALVLSDASSADTEVSFSSAPVGDYLLRLTCSDGSLTTSSDLKLVIFEAHESKTGATVNSPGSALGFADAGKTVTPAGLWLFDDDLTNAVPGGEDATFVIVKGVVEPAYEEGRFGKALRVYCSAYTNNCAQLGLGNPEPELTPWPAMSVSVYFKANKSLKLKFAEKGNFAMGSPLEMVEADLSQWHHYVMVQDPKMKKVYFDGVLVTLESGVDPRTEEDAKDGLIFGIKEGHPSYGFDGLVDEIAVFDFVLSNTEVGILFNQGAEAFTARADQNPYWMGAYNNSMLENVFPAMPENPDYTGFVLGETPSTDSPAAYVHPRILFTPEELPDLRRRLSETTAGNIAMENVRTTLEDLWPTKELLDKNFTLQEFLDSSAAGFSTQLDQLMIYQSFRCLIDGDRAVAVRVAQQLDFLADDMRTRLETEMKAWNEQQTWTVGFTGWDLRHSWQHVTQPILLRGVTVAFCYDFLYPYMTTGTRDKVRSLIAMATNNTWSIGMDAVEAFPALTSNWIPWVTGDLFLTILAIEGEDGFDEGVYRRAAEVYKGFGSIGISEISGETYEGTGKNSITAPKFLVLAKHGYPQYIAMPGIKKHATQVWLHTMQPNGLIIKDDQWGSIEVQPPICEVAAMKYAFPDDKVIDWVYRNAIFGSGYGGFHDWWGGGEGDLKDRWWAPSRTATYDYNNFITGLVYVQDWDGPADYAEHGLSATSDVPLTYVAEDRGELITRSAWGDPDAAWLWFNVRSIPGGHSAPARGEFCFYALGEVWAFYTAGQSHWKSEYHSVIMVDGVGQARYVPGKFMQYQDSEQATFGTVDTRQNYGLAAFGGSWGGQTVNSYLLKPGPYKWMDQQYADLPQWYSGTTPELDRGRKLSRTPPGMFPKAFRTVGLVRSSPQPYALIFDDIQKDDQEHEFSWRLNLKRAYTTFNRPNGIHDFHLVNFDYFTPDGNDFILKQTDGGPARLLVRLLEGSTPYESVGIETYNWPKFTFTFQDYTWMYINTTTVSARFRVLLWPLKDETSVRPSTSWDEAGSTLRIGDDELKLSETELGATVVESMKVGDSSVAFETNSVFVG